MPAGRPSLYRDEYCEQLVAFCADGYSVASFAAEIDVARSTINKWAEEHPEFSEAVERAKAKRARWWEDRAREVAQEGGPGGQATMVIFGLKNHAPDDFRDKTEHELSGKDGAPLTPVLNVVIASPDKSGTSPQTGNGPSNKGD